MARLHKGEGEQKKKRVWWLLRSAVFGVTEAEAADDLGWERRRLNNYLRDLQKDGQAERKGRRWFSRG